MPFIDKFEANINEAMQNLTTAMLNNEVEHSVGLNLYRDLQDVQIKVLRAKLSIPPDKRIERAAWLDE